MNSLVAKLQNKVSLAKIIESVFYCKLIYLKSNKNLRDVEMKIKIRDMAVKVQDKINDI